jgi:hypothetical protein
VGESARRGKSASEVGKPEEDQQGNPEGTSEVSGKGNSTSNNNMIYLQAYEYFLKYKWSDFFTNCLVAPSVEPKYGPI